jgi:hypothetical protein
MVNPFARQGLTGDEGASCLLSTLVPTHQSIQSSHLVDMDLVSHVNLHELLLALLFLATLPSGICICSRLLAFLSIHSQEFGVFRLTGCQI